MLLLHPWLWNADDMAGGGAWNPPATCRGSIDLASRGQIEAATPGQPRGWGIFECDELPKDLTEMGGVLLAGEDIREARPDGRSLDAWESLLGYRPGGDTFADLVWDQLTAGADPANADRSGVLMPTMSRRLEIIFGGNVLRRERFDFGQHPHTAQVTAVLKRQLEQARLDALDGKLISPVTRQPDGEYHRRILDAILEKYVGPNESLKAELFPLLKPSTWLANEGPLPHATTISESFNTADSTTLGPDLTWTETQGSWEVLSNEARANANTSGSSSNSARAESDLSSTDHSAQVEIRNIPEGVDRNRGVHCRFNSGNHESYLAQVRDNAGATDSWQTFRRNSAGTYTAIGTNTTVNAVVGDTVKLEVNGSTITRYRNGTSQNAATDTTHGASLRTGLFAYCSGTGTFPTVDNFTAEDLAAASAGDGPIFDGRAFPRGRLFHGSALTC